MAEEPTLHFKEIILNAVTAELRIGRKSLYIFSPPLILFILTLMMLNILHSTSCSSLQRRDLIELLILFILMYLISTCCCNSCCTPEEDTLNTDCLDEVKSA